MDPENTPSFSAASAHIWQRLCTSLARIPVRVRIVLGFFLVAVTFMAIHTAVTAKTASLHLKVQHSFRSAQIHVWVDDELAYSGKLAGSLRKKFGFLPDSVQGSLSQIIAVSSGKHLIRVQVSTDDGSMQEETISGEFIPNAERNLSVSARRGDVSLAWQGGSPAPLEAASSSGWVGRYGNTLLLTIAGSIISALTGYAVRELPGQIRNRQQDASKAHSASAGR